MIHFRDNEVSCSEMLPCKCKWGCSCWEQSMNGLMHCVCGSHTLLFYYCTIPSPCDAHHSQRVSSSWFGELLPLPPMSSVAVWTETQHTSFTVTHFSPQLLILVFHMFQLSILMHCSVNHLCTTRHYTTTQCKRSEYDNS